MEHLDHDSLFFCLSFFSRVYHFLVYKKNWNLNEPTPLWWKIIYSDLFWDHDQLLSCHWALRRTFTFEGKGLTYSPLVYVFSVLHTDPHTSALLDCVRVLVPYELRTSQFLSSYILKPCAKITDTNTRNHPPFFLYLVWWHLTLFQISLKVPTAKCPLIFHFLTLD